MQTGVAAQTIMVSVKVRRPANGAPPATTNITMSSTAAPVPSVLRPSASWKHAPSAAMRCSLRSPCASCLAYSFGERVGWGVVTGAGAGAGMLRPFNPNFESMLSEPVGVGAEVSQATNGWSNTQGPPKPTVTVCWKAWASLTAFSPVPLGSGQNANPAQ